MNDADRNGKPRSPTPSRATANGSPTSHVTAIPPSLTAPSGYRAMLTKVTFTSSDLAPTAQGCGSGQVLKYTVPVPEHGNRTAVGIGLGLS